ncbi:MAG: beta-class carbonic anhydrase [Acidimicrobiia bacterium]
MTDPDFTDILEANAEYAAGFRLAGLAPEAARGLGVVTCIDSRIEPLTMLGLVPGDAKIVRNAGARITEDALRSLVLAVHLLGVDRIALIAHTRCRMTQATNGELRDIIGTKSGVSAEDWDFGAVLDQHATLIEDLKTIRDCPLMPDSLLLAGFIYDVDTGALTLVTRA